MENHRFLIFVSHQLMYESRWKNMTKMTMGIGYRLRQDCRDAQKKYVMHCMTRISQQECRGILEQKGGMQIGAC